MRKRLIILCLFTANIAFAQVKPNPDWVNQKYSMFIHWGLYSELGGVWEGVKITKGYSEQIQSFAGMFSDYYAAVADRFNPVKWNADSIVALAKAAGMKSIVFTSKHHDGFCMYHSKYTDYNIVDATPFRRDVMKELSDACQRQGVKFAVYYSLIDWHFPEAYPISSHNADPITPTHHEYSMKQVEEIMTNYGPISEIWFDMGSLRGYQSKELYDLVNRLQPQCMVSGRLGNDRGDFAVMADNAIPEYKIGVPWQTAASFFHETWSYRSWQERGDLQDKINEKINNMIKVVSRGGNYLLNIGPRGDGSVVEFEKEALLAIGKWMNKYGDGIYNTEANPFDHSFAWGDVTKKNNSLYLFIDKLPTNNKIDLNGIIGTPVHVNLVSGNQSIDFTAKGNNLSIHIPQNTEPENGIIVAKIEFPEPFRVIPDEVIKSKKFTAKNAIPIYAHSSMDYYSSFQSTVGYKWYFENTKKEILPRIVYTANEKDKIVDVTIDDETKEILLNAGNTYKLNNDINSVKLLSTYVNIIWKDRFRVSPQLNEYINPVDNPDWFEMVCARYNHEMKFNDTKEKQGVIILHELESPKTQEILVEVGIADGLQVILNGETILIRTYVGGIEKKNEIILLPLVKGKNQLVVKLHNRYEKEIRYVLKTDIEQLIYKQQLPSFKLSEGRYHECTLQPNKPANKNSDMGMRDVYLEL